MSLRINYPVSISCCSALAGRNPYKLPEAAFAELIYTYRKDDYDDLLQAYNTELRCKEYVDLILAKFPNYKRESWLSDTEIYNSLINQKDVNEYIESCTESKSIEEPIVSKHANEEIQQEVILSQQKIESKLSEEKVDTTDIVNEVVENTQISASTVTEVVNKCRGRNMENPAIIKLEKKLGTNIFDRQSYFRRGFKTDVFTYCIFGKIDGAVSNADGSICVIEIKNRMKQSTFNKVPEYDLDQLAMYIYLHPSATNGRVVNQYNGEIYIDTLYDKAWATERWEKVIRPGLESSLLLYIL